MSEHAYDYIIVGGGAAGAVLASRLSEASNLKVARIEAGRDTPPGAEPADTLDAYPIVAYFNRLYHWQNLTVHLNDPAPGAAGRRYEQARVMGGGTSINGQFAFRGVPWDYDHWREDGAEGWGWDDVLPYFRKLETDLDYGDSQLHGSHGPLPLRRIPPKDWSPFAKTVARVLDAQGVRNIGDHNGVLDDGCFPMTINNVDSPRVSTARAYLTREVRARPNLTILAETEMMELSFDGARVTGLKAAGPHGLVTLKAREVILSTGALQTPAHLMRAGIGPAAHLKEHGITVRVDRPGVGQNLQDHPMVAFATYLPKSARLPARQRRHIQLGYRYSSGLPQTTPGDMFVLPSNRAAWQVCTSPTRFFIHDAVYQPFVERFVELASTLKVGNGLDAGTQMGPMIARRRLAAMEELVNDAVAKGAQLKLGGCRLGNQGHFFAPTVLADVPADAAIMSTEPFGPIAPLTSFASFDEMIDRANALPYGLASFVFTRSGALAARTEEALDAGLVGVNHMAVSTPETPFGGVNESGYGSESGIEGLDAFLRTKFVTELAAL